MHMVHKHACRQNTCNKYIIQKKEEEEKEEEEEEEENNEGRKEVIFHGVRHSQKLRCFPKAELNEI